MASPFPRLIPPHFFAPVKHFVFSFSGAKKRQLPRTLGDINIDKIDKGVIIKFRGNMKINKKLFVLVFCIFLNNLYATDFNIHEPETKIDLPEELIGRFMIYPVMREIEINPNNLFFISRELVDGDIMVDWAYGHITRENGRYYLITKSGHWPILFEKTEIIITDDGFLFYGLDSQLQRWNLINRQDPLQNNENNILYNARKNRMLSLSEQTKNINIVRLESVNQYYIIQSEPQIIIPSVTKFELIIRNGIVTLRKKNKMINSRSAWEGIMEINIIDQYNLNGNIISENYNFAYANDGIASIEIMDDKIIISMYCNQFGFDVNIPEDLETNFPVIYVIEW